MQIKINMQILQEETAVHIHAIENLSYELIMRANLPLNANNDSTQCVSFPLSPTIVPNTQRDARTFSREFPRCDTNKKRQIFSRAV